MLIGPIIVSVGSMFDVTAYGNWANNNVIWLLNNSPSGSCSSPTYCSFVAPMIPGSFTVTLQILGYASVTITINAVPAPPSITPSITPSVDPGPGPAPVPAPAPSPAPVPVPVPVVPVVPVRVVPSYTPVSPKPVPIETTIVSTGTPISNFMVFVILLIMIGGIIYMTNRNKI